MTSQQLMVWITCIYVIETMHITTGYVIVCRVMSHILRGEAGRDRNVVCTGNGDLWGNVCE